MCYFWEKGKGEGGKLRITNYELRILELNDVSTFQPLNSAALNPSTLKHPM